MSLQPPGECVLVVSGRKCPPAEGPRLAPPGSLVRPATVVESQWFMGKHLEFYLVLGLLFFNAGLGFVQEERANAALEALKQRLSVHARVRRDGQ